jgi:hypothetical protein
MKVLITAFALVIASPTLAQLAASPSSQLAASNADRDACQAGQTDMCYWHGYPLWQWYSGA